MPVIDAYITEKKVFTKKKHRPWENLISDENFNSKSEKLTSAIHDILNDSDDDKTTAENKIKKVGNKNRDKPDTNQIQTRDELDTNQIQIKDKPDTKQVQTRGEQKTNQIQTKDKTKDKKAEKEFSFLSLSDVQKKVLLYVFSECQKNENRVSDPTRIADICLEQSVKE